MDPEMDPELTLKLEEKFAPALHRFKEGKHDDHDIFPALLGVLLRHAQKTQETTLGLTPLFHQGNEQLIKAIEAITLPLREFGECAEKQKVALEEIAKKYQQDGGQHRGQMDDITKGFGHLAENQKAVAQSIKNSFQYDILQLRQQMEKMAPLIEETQKAAMEERGIQAQKEMRALLEQVEGAVALMNETRTSLTHDMRRTRKWLGAMFFIQIVAIGIMGALLFIR